MIDGANQEVEQGNFAIFSRHKSGQLSIGFVVKQTATKVTLAKPWIWEGKHETVNKTPERIIQVSDEIAESMNPDFFNKMRNDIPYPDNTYTY